MTAVKVAQRAVVIASENRNHRVLISGAILAAEIVFESADWFDDTCRQSFHGPSHFPAFHSPLSNY
jgi:hypothetical protein